MSMRKFFKDLIKEIVLKIRYITQIDLMRRSSSIIFVQMSKYCSIVFKKIINHTIVSHSKIRLEDLRLENIYKTL